MKAEADPFGYITLRLPAVRSPNYVEGSNGWTINQDGSAEFNNLEIRGTFLGTDFEMNSEGIFFYSGVPALGNLLLALAPASGFDSLGNAYAQGLSIGSGPFSIVIGETGGSPLILFTTNRTAVSSSSSIQTVVQGGAGLAQYEQVQILGARDTTELDSVASSWSSSSPDGSQHATISHFYGDSGGILRAYFQASYQGCLIRVGSITAAQPGTGTSSTNAALPESWHALSLGAGFTSNAADQAPRIRLDGLGGGIARLDGVVYTSAATAAGATIATVAAYAPKLRKRFPADTSFSGYAAGATGIMVSAAGVITAGPAASAAGQQLILDGMSWPID